MSVPIKLSQMHLKWGFESYYSVLWKLAGPWIWCTPI